MNWRFNHCAPARGPAPARNAHARRHAQRVARHLSSEDTEKGVSSDVDSTRLTIGHYHPLSKRTSLNASYVARENQVRYNANGSAKTDRTSRGYNLSLRHLF